MTDQQQMILDPSDLRKYRTELPNLYDDAGLDAYSFRLLAHYKRVGECTENLETTARKCCMSEGKISETRQALADAGWITLQRVAMDANRYRYIVRVVDRWVENFARYSGLSQEEVADQVKNASASRSEPSASPHEASASPREGKKEPIKNQDTRFAAVAQKLADLTGGGLNPTSADMIGIWLETHSDEWICKAIEIAQKKGARSQNYVDAILIGWEANGYPKTRDEKVQGAKHAAKSTTRSSRKTDPSASDQPLSTSQQAAIERVNNRRAQRHQQPA